MGVITILIFLVVGVSTVVSVLISKRKVPIDEMEYMPETPTQTQDLPPQPVPVPEPVEVPVTPVQAPVEAPNPLTMLLPWTTQKNYFHNVRVLCDRALLTYEQKEIVCGCIWIESRFRDYYPDRTPVTNGNKDATGKVWSTDWGLVQCNDYFNIGPNKPFPTVDYVLKNPAATAAWMISTMKTTGHLQPWASYTSGAYKASLLPTSGMQALRS